MHATILDTVRILMLHWAGGNGSTHCFPPTVIARPGVNAIPATLLPTELGLLDDYDTKEAFSYFVDA